MPQLLYSMVEKEGQRSAEDTYKERKAKAFSKGKKYFYIICPLCQLGKPFRTHVKGKTVFNVQTKPEVLQVRYGVGGRGTGFFRKDDECLDVWKLKDNYPEVFENLKEEVTKLHRMLNAI